MKYKILSDTNRDFLEQELNRFAENNHVMGMEFTTMMDSSWPRFSVLIKYQPMRDQTSPWDSVHGKAGTMRHI